MADERIVSIGLLSKRDLQLLGENFDRAIPITDDDIFADLLSRLDEVEASPFGKGVVLIFPGKPSEPGQPNDG